MPSPEVQALVDQVAHTKGVTQSAILLLTNLRERLEEAGTDGAALAQIKDDLAATTDQLAAAVAANPGPGDPPAEGEPLAEGE
jgi:hypothetical protein